VPDEVVVEMVKSRLAQPDVQGSGWLLDGYPRSASQAEAIEKEGIRPDVFLLIDVRCATWAALGCAAWAAGCWLPVLLASACG
jgi:adenylate kinase family enzyme